MNWGIFWQGVSYFGDIQYWIGFAVATIVAYYLVSGRDRKRIFLAGIFPLVAVIISRVFVEILRGVFMVARPCVGIMGCPLSYSFPSGHAAAVFAFVTAFWFITKKRIVSMVLLFIALAVAISRVALNYHTFLDVGAGAVVGIVIGSLLYLVYKLRAWE